MQNRTIRDGQISASSQYDATHAAIQGRLHFQATGKLRGAWSARINDANQWLQVYLCSESILITGVATQGRNGCCRQWVTKYKLQYSDDKVNFRYYREPGESIKVTKITPDTEKTFFTLTFYSKGAVILNYYYYYYFVFATAFLFYL